MDWSHWPSEEVGNEAWQAAYRAAAHAVFHQQVAVATHQYGYDVAFANWRYQRTLEMIGDNSSRYAIFQSERVDNGFAQMTLRHSMWTSHFLQKKHTRETLWLRF